MSVIDGTTARAACIEATDAAARAGAGAEILWSQCENGEPQVDGTTARAVSVVLEEAEMKLAKARELIVSNIIEDGKPQAPSEAPPADV